MKIVTWNINGIRARLPLVLEWLKQHQPDIIALQEIKCMDENFPKLEFEDLGYNVEIFGQKSFNGVALLSKIPFDEVNRSLAGNDEDEQARLIEGVFSTETGVVRICNIYLPNGNPVNGDKQYYKMEKEQTAGVFHLRQGFGGQAGSGAKRPTATSIKENKSDKFPYKLSWMDRLIEFTKQRLKFEEPFILLGDFNIIPSKLDVHNAKAWWGDALYRPESLEKFRTLQNLGLVDAIRSVSNEPNYSFWDFQAGAWRKNNGIRIDFLMLSSQAADCLVSAKTHKDARGLERPSDHVPVEAVFEF